MQLLKTDFQAKSNLTIGFSIWLFFDNLNHFLTPGFDQF